VLERALRRNVEVFVEQRVGGRGRDWGSTGVQERVSCEPH
jgi:hypothetical protein